MFVYISSVCEEASNAAGEYKLYLDNNDELSGDRSRCEETPWSLLKLRFH